MSLLLRTLSNLVNNTQTNYKDTTVIMYNTVEYIGR